MPQDPPHETLDTPDGSALTWIFDHCLRYADSYEISLRAAYELNRHPTRSITMGSSSFAQSSGSSLFSRNSAYSKKSKSSRSSESSYDTGSYDANAEFRACLTRTVSELPSQPCSLPPNFIVSFLRRCFCLELSDVDFAQGLTALDYLNDLQNRWKKEIDAAFRRLSVSSQDAKDPKHSVLARKYPGVMLWYKGISDKAYIIDALYTQVYLGMRRWILVNEMMLEPINKPNCLALLNTLFPPQSPGSLTPTQHLTHKNLENQRDAFFKFITTVETNPAILDPVMTQGANPGDENGWPALWDTFDRYLNAVIEMIDECALINEPNQVDKSGAQRRTDSGISFGPRPATSHSTDAAHSTDAEKPLSEFPVTSDGPSRHGSLMERLTHSFSSWGKKKDKKDKVPQKEPHKDFAWKLKKMQSCKELHTSFGKFGNPSDFSKMSDEAIEQRRRFMIDEANARKAAQAAQAEAQTIGQAI